MFRPHYQFKSKEKATASNQATQKAEEISQRLKDLGVADEDIKVAVDSFMGRSFPENESDEYTYTAALTIRVDSKDKAQEVQNYLVTTQPLGSVTPESTFSDTRRNELEAEARDAATKDARAKADQSAKNLGFKLGRVKSVEDGIGFGDGHGPITLEARGTAVAMDSGAASSPIRLQPGQNEIRYSVTVTYYVR